MKVVRLRKEHPTPYGGFGNAGTLYEMGNERTTIMRSRWFQKTVVQVVVVTGVIAPSFVHSQIAQVPVPWLIQETKQSVLPVVAWLTDSTSDSVSQGTGVLIGKGQTVIALTCEHVVAVKDSVGRTIRYAKKVVVLANSTNGKSVPVDAQLIYADESRDFALLALNPSEKDHAIHLKYIQASRWQRSTELQEGETIIYIGYPMSIGVGKSNNPLSRTGIISQLVPGQSYFLVDGFVQHGHSGSPVFVLREVGQNLPPTWDTYLVGIAAAFPKEFTDVLEEVSLRREDGKSVILNPGFTFVTSMDEVISVMDKNLDVRK